MNPSEETESSDWMIALDWVLHVPSGLVSRCVKVYEPDEYRSPVNNQPLHDYAIELANGNVFLARRENFVPLTDHEASFFNYTQDHLTSFLKKLVTAGGHSQIPAPTVLTLLAAVLEEQTTIFQTGRDQLKKETRHNEG